MVLEVIYHDSFQYSERDKSTNVTEGVLLTLTGVENQNEVALMLALAKIFDYSYKKNILIELSG